MAPERDRPSPPSTFAPRDFASREVGVLSEQGGLDRARMLLAKGLTRAPDEPDLYVDAIRLERTAIHNARAWEVWMSRALEGRVAVAERVLAIVPEAELREFMRGHDASWELLAHQGREPAIELLRLRLVAQLYAEPTRALEAIEDSSMQAAAQSDLRLQELALGVMLATGWRSATRVARVMPAYRPMDPHTHTHAHAPLFAALDEILALASAFIAASGAQPLPPPLERAIVLLGWGEQRLDHKLRGELSFDLRAQPDVHLHCVDAFLEKSQRLAEHVSARFAAANARPSPPREDLTRAAAENAARITQSLEADSMRYFRGNAALYRKHARAPLMLALAQHRLNLPAWLAHVRSGPSLATRTRSVLACADEDLALHAFGNAAQE